MPTIFNKISKDIMFGLYSGFPLCCIAFYNIKISYPKLNNKYRNFTRRRKIRCDYVPCPLCVIRHNYVLSRTSPSGNDDEENNFLEAIKVWADWNSKDISLKHKENIENTKRRWFPKELKAIQQYWISWYFHPLNIKNEYIDENNVILVTPIEYTPYIRQLPQHVTTTGRKKEIEDFYNKMISSIDLEKELMSWAKRIYGIEI